MNGALSPNAQAILLLTAPLLMPARQTGRRARHTGQGADRSKQSRSPVRPLPQMAYISLARHLFNEGLEPADLLAPEGLRELEDAWPRLRIRRKLGDVHRLLGRGFLLSQVLERWNARTIWVTTRADEDYPHRLRKKMREKAPPVLYGCGDRSALDDGGLAVVGSRKINEALVEYTERVGQLAAEASAPIVSGGARGVDQASMRGALEAGGRAIGVLGHGLERAALNRANREPLLDGRLALVSSFDPAVRFRGWQAMERNKLIYALADAALVVNSDHGHGGTWAGATEQLHKLRFVTVFVRKCGELCEGLDALGEMGARQWPEPETPERLHQILAGKEPPEPIPAEEGSANANPQYELGLGDDTEPRTDSRSQGPMAPTPTDPAAVREGTASPAGKPAHSAPTSCPPEVSPAIGKAATKLLPVIAGEMTREEILAALSLQHWGNVRNRYLVPCLDAGLVEMTLPEKPTSPKQRYRLTPVGHKYLASMP